MPLVLTIQDRLTQLRRLLEVVENCLTDPQHEESEANRKTRHQIALMNFKQLSDTAQAAERDLADGLIHEPFLTSIGLRYRPSDSEI